MQGQNAKMQGRKPLNGKPIHENMVKGKVLNMVTSGEATENAETTEVNDKRFPLLNVFPAIEENSIKFENLKPKISKKSVTFKLRKSANTFKNRKLEMDPKH